MVLSSNWLRRLRDGIRGCGGSRAPTCFACASSSRRTATTKKSRHWCDNCRGVITSSFLVSASSTRNACSTYAARLLSGGASGSLRGSVALTHFSAVVSPPALSTALQAEHPGALGLFKDVYSLDLLELPDEHTEADLHRGLLRNLGRFITELGRDFCFVGSEYPVQVGKQDFALDLVFFHRGLCCLVAVELKVREVRPEDLGKLRFYLEALDRDVRKPHERP